MLKALKTMQRYAKLFLIEKGKGEAEHMEKLTTKELLVLSVLEQAINEELDMTTISWDSAGIKHEEETRIFEILEDYGYIASDDIEEGVYEITNQGYQYLRLCEKELEEVKNEAEQSKGNINIGKLAVKCTMFNLESLIGTVSAISIDFSTLGIFGLVKKILNAFLKKN